MSDPGVRRRRGDESSFRVPMLMSSGDGDNGTPQMQIPILQEIDGCFGFVFHNACWCLLERRAQPLQIPLHRLMKVFESAPRDQDDMLSCCYTWDHLYGGITSFIPQHWGWQGMRWSWEERRCRDTGIISTAMIARYRSPFASAVHDLLGTLSTQSKTSEITTTTKHRWGGSDCFANLPLEIVDEIAYYLPTATVLGLRLVSRAFTQLYYSQIFWASRFRIDHERGYLFEACETRSSRDWLWLYWRTRHITNTYPGLENRRRIWSLAGLLLEKLTLKHADPSTHLPITRRLSNWDKSEVHGDIIVEGELRKKCSSLVIVPQETQVPPDVYRVGVSVITEGEATYIAGVQFSHGAKGNVIQFGYVTDPGLMNFVNVDSLNGFIVSVGSRGVQALQVVDGKDITRSPWLGCPQGGAKTRRLVFNQRLAAVSAGFDVRKR